jgi:hypothetical protein
MKINNSAELSELIGQVILMLHSKGMVIIPEEVGFDEFEKNNIYAANSIWGSFERGTLDISATPEDKDFVDFMADSMARLAADRSVVPDNLPTDADVIDYLEARMGP